MIWSCKVAQNVQDIRRSGKVYREYHGTLASGIDSRKKKHSRNENPERYITGRCAITIIICNSDDATK